MSTKTASLLLVTTLLLAGCADRAGQAQAKRTEELLKDPEIPVKVVTLEPTTWINSLDVTGSIVAGEDSQVGAKLGGRLVSVMIKDGDSVGAGQVIAVQESSELRRRKRQAEAQVRAAEAQLRQALRDAQVGPERSTAGVRAARARLAQSEATLLKLRNGARSEERAQVDAQLRAAKSNLATAKNDLDRGEVLFKEGAIAQKDLDRYRNVYAGALAQYESALESQRIMQSGSRDEDIRQAQAAVNAAKESLQDELAKQRLDAQYDERVTQARAALDSAREAVALADEALGDTAIRAPFSGRVSGKPIQAGTFLAPGMAVARIISGEGLYFEGDIPESAISAVRPGMPVSITVDALKDTTFSGQILAVDPRAQSLGRLYKVRIGVTAGSAQLKNGMYARGTIELGRQDNVITVPNEAIRTDADGTYVYAVVNGKSQRSPVKRVGENKGKTAVDGLGAGMQVIVQGQALVTPGTPVKVENGSTKS